MQSIIRSIDGITEWLGERVKWVTTLLVVLIFVDVVLRYFFSTTKAWVIELEWHLFALIFLLGAAYALQKGQHVRVDLFYAKFSERKKAWVDMIGTILFLIPWCLIAIVTSWRYARNSLAFLETSPDPGGLPARYAIKFVITIGFCLLLIQAFAVILRSVSVLLGKKS